MTWTRRITKFAPLLALLVLTVGSTAASAAGDPAAGCTTTIGQTTCVFAYTGAAQTWTVPSGVTSATFDLYGAEGGTSTYAGILTAYADLGGRATATLTVTPGATLQVNVGGRGRDGESTVVGFNGGFNGGNEGGGGGGGASDIRGGAYALADRVLVAGGGGGSGGHGGGRGGGASGEAGTNTTLGVGGGGGSQSAGGSGGGSASSSGAAGQLGMGGFGGGSATNSGDGGGGGGGYYGGGGGGSAYAGSPDHGAGGGGGSGFGPVGTTFQTGVRAGDGLVTITYAEPSVSSPLVGLAPASLNFGDMPLGSTAAAPLTITNTGGGDLQIGQLAVQGTNANDFGLMILPPPTGDGCSNKSLGAGQSCEVDVTFAPKAVGARSATLSIPSNAASSPDGVALSGTGTSSATIVFSGGAPDGTVGVPYSFAYSASGDSGITFSVLGSLPPGLTFDPTSGTLNGTPATAGGYMFVVRATGASGASKDLDEAIVISPPLAPPTVLLSSTTVSFGDQLVGSSSAARTVTIGNALFSSQSLVLGSLSVAGVNSADFTLGNDTCSGARLAPGGSCTVDVRFAPTATGSRGASLVVPSSAVSGPDSIALSGNGTAPSADVRVSISGPSSALNGTQNTYVMNVSNAGPAKALGVTMTVQVPAGTKFVGVTTTHGSCTHPASGATSGTIRCSLGDLASGAAAIDSVTLKLALSGKGGSIAVVAQVASSSTPDPDLSNNVASLTTTLKKK
jgi:uncharacterized repeat protein (TIGR01451 family)